MATAEKLYHFLNVDMATLGIVLINSIVYFIILISQSLYNGLIVVWEFFQWSFGWWSQGDRSAMKLAEHMVKCLYGLINQIFLFIFIVEIKLANF